MNFYLNMKYESMKSVESTKHIASRDYEGICYRIIIFVNFTFTFIKYLQYYYILHFVPFFSILERTQGSDC